MNIIKFNTDDSLPIEKYWKNHKAANYGLTHLIQLLGANITYVETGVSKGDSLGYIIQRCKNINAAYGIDFYKENTDEFEVTKAFYSQKTLDRNFERAKQVILSSGEKDKITIIKEDVEVAVNYFKDNTIDFLFLDHYLNEKDVSISLETWYNKVKIGGYFSGHDWIYDGVRDPVINFREKYEITSPLSVFGGEWVWKKEENI